MMDWGLIAKIAGGGFGIVMLVLAILTAVVWILGLAARKPPEKGKEGETKGRKT
jgi:Na+-transporting methylmalonyl-CoA/oxaloacetate decarboxylase gamma subunit